MTALPRRPLLAGLAAVLVAPALPLVLALPASAAAPTGVALATPADLQTGVAAEGFTITLTNSSGAAESAERADLVLSGLAGLRAAEVTLDYKTTREGTAYSPVTERDQADGTVTGALGSGTALAPGQAQTYYVRIRLAPGSPRGTLTTTALAVDASAAAKPTDGSASGTSTVYTVPGAPKILAVTSRDGALAVAVSAPADTGGSPLTGYRATATAGSRTVSVDAGTPTLTIPGLTNGVTYSVTVRARSKAGLGAASAAVLGVPQVPPLALTMTGGPTFVRYGSTVTYAGRLTRGGVALAGVRVTVGERYVDGRTVGLGVTLTRVDGSWSLRNKPIYNSTVTAEALGATVGVPRRVILVYTAAAATAGAGTVTVTASTAPGFITGAERAERVQLLELDSRGRVLRVLALVNAAQRHGARGQAHGVNDIRFRAALPTGTHRLVVKVIGTPVNTGAPSHVLTVTV